LTPGYFHGHGLHDMLKVDFASTTSFFEVDVIINNIISVLLCSLAIQGGISVRNLWYSNWNTVKI